MNARLLPVLFAAAALAASALLFLPRADTPPSSRGFTEPILPHPAEIPTPCAIPPEITIFGKPSRVERTLALSTDEAKGRPGAKTTYRLCGFAGGAEGWVVAVEDGAGRYHTLKSGDRIEGTALEFRGMEFSFAAGLPPQSRAVFFDLSSLSRVDVTASTGPDK
jgi:hypothetical protein